MTTLQDFRQSLSRLVEGGRKRRRLRRELAQLAAMGSLDAVLADIGLVRSQVEPLLEGCGRADDQLDRMLARLRIDPARLPVESLRDMTWTCLGCPDKGHCRRWLSDGAATDFHGFCPNAEALDEALARKAPGTAAAPAPLERRPAASAGSTPGDTWSPTADDRRRLDAEARQREVRALLDSAM